MSVNSFTYSQYHRKEISEEVNEDQQRWVISPYIYKQSFVCDIAATIVATYTNREQRWGK